jgi:hypothetical protein
MRIPSDHLKTNNYKRMKYILISILIFLIGCHEKDNHKTKSVELTNNLIKIEPEEHYVDSTNIGLPNKYKIELKKFRTEDSVFVKIEFYEKQKSKWILKQHLQSSKDGIISCDPKISDFNNDGFNDFTFKSSVAARGANEIRNLYIFNAKNGQLQFIKNSTYFPNMRYNNVLDCIDAFRVYGGCQTAFAKLESDSLREFANVELFDKRIIITTIDKGGKTKEIKNEKFNDESFIRFSNYKPLKELKEEY